MAGVVRRLPVVYSAVDPPDELKIQTWIQMVRAYQASVRRLAAALAADGLTLPQFDLIATLLHSAGVTQQELAARLLVTKGNVCGLLNRLERAGWVERRPDPTDARANRLYLTPAGRQKVDSVRPAHDAVVARLLGGLPAADVDRLRRALGEIEAAAGREPDDPLAGTGRPAGTVPTTPAGDAIDE